MKNTYAQISPRSGHGLLLSTEKTTKQIKYPRGYKDDLLPQSEKETLNFDIADHYSEYDEEHDCIVSKFVRQNPSDSLCVPDQLSSQYK